MAVIIARFAIPPTTASVPLPDTAVVWFQGHESFVALLGQDQLPLDGPIQQQGCLHSRLRLQPIDSRRQVSREGVPLPRGSHSRNQAW